MYKLSSSSARIVRALFLIAVVFGSHAINAQTDDFAARREAAIKLVNERKFGEALPILEKLSADKNADGQVFLGLGLTYWNLQDPAPEKAKPMRLKALNALLKAKEMGVSLPDVDLVIASIRPDGGDKGDSENPEATAAGDEAFRYFAAGEYRKAAVAYEKAATLDPKHYESALYTGNSYYAMGEFDKAGVWFAKAIALDPDREIAYRYWADGLFKQGKDKAAVDKYLDAVIAEPYSGTAWRGISQYASQKGIKLAHAKVTVPVEFSAAGDGNTKITLGNMLGDKKDDGSFAWTVYGISRAAWQTGKDGKLSKDFAAAYPGEKVYRHSLAEELHSLRMVLTVLRESKDAKNPEPSLVMLKRLEADGVLEAYILLVRADAGIRRDYPAYRRDNRDKIRKYITDYVMTNGGTSTSAF
jgi:tetratricopeptide (TPR) repeat protein